MPTCKGCGKSMIWGVAGTMKIPLDPRAPVYRITGQGANGDVVIEREAASMVSHFSTCPKASQFSSGKKK